MPMLQYAGTLGPPNSQTNNWHGVIKCHLSNEKRAPNGCLGDLLGMKYYPVI